MGAMTAAATTDALFADPAASPDVLPGGEPLLARVRAEAGVPGTTAIRLALGYLFVPGMASLLPALEASTASEIHLLIGNTAGTLTDEQQVALADAATRAGGPSDARSPDQDVARGARTARARVTLETARALRENLAHLSPGDTHAQNGLLILARLASAGRLRVRVYTGGRLHAKAYLFSRTPPTASVALVGSSNLSLPQNGNPTELNVVVRFPAVADVETWFNFLWDGAQDFTRDLLREVLSLPLPAPATDAVPALTKG